ncbi:Sec1-like protein [Panus rudis PR-1116 ss-1]|nr:Sec1-like protein [Panus rudis PR-1116 ss-1]
MAAASSSTAPADDTSSRPSQDVESPLDISVLREIARNDLVDALNSVNGAKTLVLDPTLAGPLSLITEVTLLKHHGVDKMFWLEPGPLSATTTNIIYLCRPLIKWIKIVADQVKRHAREGQKHTYTLLLVPRKSTLVSRVLEEEGVLGDINISSYNLQFIPLADDVISLEHEDAFKELWVDGDETVIFNSAQALISLEKQFGLFPRIVGKGDYAARLCTLLTRHLPASSADDPANKMLNQASEKFDALIVLDRRVDMITPLLTQLTYEGLIDEMFGIKNSHVEVPASLLAPPNPLGQSNAGASSSANANAPASALTKEKKKKHHLTTATDPLFGELRDLNFSAVGKKLNQVARRLDEDYKMRHKEMSTAQLREFVGKLGGLQSEHQSLRLHTGLSEMIVPETRTDEFNKSLEIQQNLLASYEVNSQITAIEELIAQGADMQTVVRLLCLASIVTGGIKTKTLDNLKREILQAYGYNYLPLLLSLASPSLAILLPNPLPASTPPSIIPSLKYPYTSLRKSLRLLIEDPDPMEELENDISYVYSGYAPISVRLVQCVAQKGGVLSNPAGEKDKKVSISASGEAADASGKGKGLPKVHAHPIVGWKGFEDVVASIPGETVDIVQKLPGAADPAASSLLLPREQTTTTVVFFLGGCTYTEIAALRWVGRQNKGRRFLIATTGIISGSSIVESIAGTGRGASGAREAGL